MPPARSEVELTTDLVESVVALARRAGERIMDFYETPIDVRAKDDRSPVTDADDAAEEIILPGLTQIAPGITAISEEAAHRAGIANLASGNQQGCFWLVDPLDGTKEYIKRNGEFTVNIALIADGAPVFGVVHLPAIDTLYMGIVGSGASVRIGKASPRAIAARDKPDDGITVLASRSHANNEVLDKFLASEHVKERISAGSSLKFCRIAEGIADLYPRFGRTMEWDTAAGHAVLAAAGGSVRCLDGRPLQYGKPGYENPHFLARGREG